MRIQLGLSAAQAVAPEALAELLGIEVRSGRRVDHPAIGSSNLKKYNLAPSPACTLRPSADRVVVVYKSPTIRDDPVGRAISRMNSHIRFFPSHELSMDREAWWSSRSFRAIQLKRRTQPHGFPVVSFYPGNCCWRKSVVDQALARSQTDAASVMRMVRYRLNVTGVLRQRKALPREHIQVML